MRVLILGVGDAFTTNKYATGAVIDAPGGHVMIDCADLIHRALAEASNKTGWDANAKNIDDIILTHLHGDHCNGLESFGFSRYADRVRGESTIIPRIHTHPGAADRLWERLAPAMDAPLTKDGPPATLEDFFELHTFDYDTPTKIAGLEIRCRQTIHPIPTIGLLIADGDKTLGISGDTAYDPTHIEWLSEADLIIHEANFSPIHTNIDPLNNLPDELRRKMRLTHCEDSFDPKSTDIPVLHDGQVLEI